MNDAIKLYHYTKIDTLLRYILPGLKLRMNAIVNSNDPAEILLSEALSGGSAINNRILDVKSLSFCTDGESDSSLLGYEIHPIWVRCAESWSGVCLEIDYSKFIDKNIKIIEHFNVQHRQVRYTTASMESSDNLEHFLCMSQRRKLVDMEEHVESLLNNSTFVDERFYKKDRSWSHEQEFRFVALDNYDEEIVFSLEGSINAIILGARFNVQLYPVIRDLVREHGMDSDIIRKGAAAIKGGIGELQTYKSHYRANKVSAKKQKKKDLNDEILSCIRDVQKSIMR